MQNRLTSYVTAGSRTEETPNPGSGWTDIGGGTWSVTDGVLSESTATTARLLRGTAFATSNETFTFSYRSPHDPDDATDYDPERYGLALLRVIDSADPAPAGAYDVVALVLEPTGIFLREWANDTVVDELAASTEPSEVDTWYDLRVAYSCTNNTDLTGSRAKRGQPFEVLFNAITVGLAEDSSQQIGSGVGELGDYEFRDVQFTDATDTDETVEVTLQYDALGLSGHDNNLGNYPWTKRDPFGGARPSGREICL